MKTLQTLEELAADCGLPEHVLECYKDELLVLTWSIARLVAQDLADAVRETYLHEHAEGIAFNIETLYGLHGDYGDR